MSRRQAAAILRQDTSQARYQSEMPRGEQPEPSPKELPSLRRSAVTFAGTMRPGRSGLAYPTEVRQPCRPDVGDNIRTRRERCFTNMSQTARSPAFQRSRLSRKRPLNPTCTSAFVRTFSVAIFVPARAFLSSIVASSMVRGLVSFVKR